MTNTNEIRVATESWVNSSIKKEFDPIDINDVYAAFEAGANWQSRRVQGEVVAYYDPRPGVDWAYRFLEPDEIEQEDNRNFFTVPLIANQPAPAAVPEGWKLVPVEPTLGMLAALAWAGDEDLALGHAEINREIISNYGAMLTASPVPDHAAEADVCQNCETALPEGCGGIFAHNGTACRYGENQQEEAER